ncbi:MAG: hypothetical protein AAFR38_00505 [Planctomycetota bacterium]
MLFSSAGLALPTERPARDSFDHASELFGWRVEVVGGVRERRFILARGAYSSEFVTVVSQNYDMPISRTMLRRSGVTTAGNLPEAMLTTAGRHEHAQDEQLWVLGFVEPGLYLIAIALALASLSIWSYREIRRSTGAARWSRFECPACGYALAEGTDSCPECGEAYPIRPVASSAEPGSSNPTRTDA